MASQLLYRLTTTAAEKSLRSVYTHLQAWNQDIEHQSERNGDWWELLSLGVSLVGAGLNHDGFFLLDLCMEHYKIRVRAPGPEFLLDTYLAYLYLSAHLPDMAELFREYLTELANILLPYQHPIRSLWSMPEHWHLFRCRHFLRQLVNLVFDLNQGLITRCGGTSAVCNTLLCLDHLHALDLISYSEYTSRYKKCSERIVYPFHVRTRLSWSPFLLKEALSRQDWTEADQQVLAAEDLLDRSNCSAMHLFKNLLPSCEDLENEINIQGDIQADKAPLEAFMVLDGCKSTSRVKGGTQRHHNATTVAYRSKALFNLHYAKLVSRTYDVLSTEGGCNQKVISNWNGLHRCATSAQDPCQRPKNKILVDICDNSTSNGSITHHRSETSDRSSKVYLMSWLLYWLFHGSLRPVPRIERQGKYQNYFNPSTNIDQWIRSHFFPKSKNGDPNARVEYLTSTVSHHVQGGAYQVLSQHVTRMR